MSKKRYLKMVKEHKRKQRIADKIHKKLELHVSKKINLKNTNEIFDKLNNLNKEIYTLSKKITNIKMYL